MRAENEGRTKRSNLEKIEQGGHSGWAFRREKLSKISKFQKMPEGGERIKKNNLQSIHSFPFIIQVVHQMHFQATNTKDSWSTSPKKTKTKQKQKKSCCSVFLL
jgi:hypothetical protein